MRISFLSFVILCLAGCVNIEGMPNFENMSGEELFEYNSQRPLEQMIVCTDEQRSFSRVRRRVCGTVEQMYGSTAQAQRLGVLNTLPNFGNSE